MGDGCGVDDYDGLEISGSFFVMPIAALKTLRKELDRLLGDEVSATILFRHGYLSGRELGEKLDIKMDMETIVKELGNIWAEVGIGRMVNTRLNNGSIIIVITHSPEVRVSKSRPYCDFTRGYLSGLVSALTHMKYMGTEEECASVNGERCVFVLNLVEGGG